MTRLLLLLLALAALLALSTSYAAGRFNAGDGLLADGAGGGLVPDAPPEPATPEQAAAFQLMHDGNWKDAYAALSKLSLDPAGNPTQAGDDLAKAVECLRQLGRLDEMDDYGAKVIAVHAQHWPTLWAAAKTCNAVEHGGVIIAGQFHRGDPNGRFVERFVNTAARDRIRALQLMQSALKLIETAKPADAPSKTDAARFYLDLARMLANGTYGSPAWRLQILSDLSTLPDYDDGADPDESDRGAPVNADGTPVFHALPKSWQAATSDGQRWRWCLMQASELGLASEARYRFADFLRDQFDVQTMADLSYNAARSADDAKADESGPYAVTTLSDEETIARLATGIKRFKLPDEFNFIKILRTITADKGSPFAESAFDLLAQIYEDRQQYNKAADAWRQAVAEFGPGEYRQRQQHLDQILNNWGMFESVPTQSSDNAATIGFRFRNGKRVAFTATEIDVPKLLTEVKDYLKTKPHRDDSDKIDVVDLGQRLVLNNDRHLLGKVAAQWTLDLHPRDNHFDRQISVSTPLQKPGAYLVKAQMDGPAAGDPSYVVLWIADTVIIKKQLRSGAYFFLADAATGRPLPDLTINCFGYRRHYLDLQRNIFEIETTDVDRKTDADGQLIGSADVLPNDYTWLLTATTPPDPAGASGRFACFGFANTWYFPRGGGLFGGPGGGLFGGQAPFGGGAGGPPPPQAEPPDPGDLPKTFIITDRPVYRPGDTAKFKIWVNKSQYDHDGPSAFAEQSFDVHIWNPKQEKVFEHTYTADKYGGFDGEFTLPQDATLGGYLVEIDHFGGNSFRVEEYKKPEFQVTIDAPAEPVALGEKITATIKAKYYFGSPVTQGTVKYKILRSEYSATWYPLSRWDWLYGRGYWWFAYDYAWYPGWANWGYSRPRWSWWSQGQSAQPEVVAQQELPLSADGSVQVTIDTAVAKALQADTDHRYEITAEVTDLSRRTIVGAGDVLVARKPFQVYAWVDRGYYQTGDAIHADFCAQTLANKPVTGAGVLKLFRIAYDKDQKPVETVTDTWPLNPDARGLASLQIKAAAAGQYRLSYTVTDQAHHDIEGGYVFVIRDDKFTGKDFRFNDIELVPDKKEYAPGDKVRLAINTNRDDATVLLFLRPSNGVYLPPKILHLTGKSTVEEFDIAKKDMPNIFVEAVTISSGHVFSETRELVVPPEDRILNVAVTPVANDAAGKPQMDYKPGELARFQVKITDSHGEPFDGPAVVAIYDKSVEYFSAGSNVPDIQDFFWNWRRSHFPHTESSLDREGSNLIRPGAVPMSDLSVFGTIGISISDLTAGGGGGLVGGAGGLFGAGGLGGGAVAAGGLAGGAAVSAPGAEDTKGNAPAAGPQPPTLLEPLVRKNFADTALWIANLTTKNGEAQIELPAPENLTTWKARVWTLGSGTRVGEATTEFLTRKNLIVRLQAPRFFTEKDEVTLSANVHNYLKTKKTVQVVLEVEGNTLEPAEATTNARRLPNLWNLAQTISVEANGEQRVDWRVKAVNEGTAVVRMKALTDEESDAMQMSFPVYIHGMLKTDSFSGALRPDQSAASLTFNVPAERRAEQSALEVRYSPSVACAMVDALPYLVNYPYGCTEQTLDRFLPTVITQKILLDMKLDLADIQKKRTNLNAQEIGDDAQRAAQWKHYDRNPVFDKSEVAAMVTAGVDKLAAQQLSDGGWGWFSGYGEQSWPHTTAFVVHGLQVARANDVALPNNMLERGVQWLRAFQDRRVAEIRAHRADGWKADNIDAFVYMVLTDADVANAPMKTYLYEDRNDLAVYAKTMFAMALYKQKDKDKLDMLLQNISQFVVQDDENQTAYLKLPDSNYWWCWYGSEFEAHAYYLKLLARTDPKGPLAPRLAKYLINNRKHATYWNSTRDTALCVEALADFIKASGENKPDLTVAISLDGKELKKVTINAENLFAYDNKLLLTGVAVPSGKHKIEFTKTGDSPLYFNAYLTNFTLEDHITRAGLEIKVNRKYYKLVPVDKTVAAEGDRGQAFSKKVEKYERHELSEGDTLKSGDLVEAELEIDSKNDYEYILFEDMKAAGFEPVDVRSGYIPNDLGAFVEFRDNRVCFFARALARGKHSVSYRLRAEIPGQFAALPTKASAMYAPELRANSDEIKLRIEDAPAVMKAAR